VRLAKPQSPTHEYGVSVFASGPFDSVTMKYDLAKEIAGNHERPVEVVHIGDHDPSGGHMFVTLMEDVSAFVRDLGAEVIFTRLAVTPARIAEYGLPTAPHKLDDNRAFIRETCQAEALAPDMMNAILREAIEQRLDKRLLQRVLKQERQARRELTRELDELIDNQR
jgi:hypothetical protein